MRARPLVRFEPKLRGGLLKVSAEPRTRSETFLSLDLLRDRTIVLLHKSTVPANPFTVKIRGLLEGTFFGIQLQGGRIRLMSVAHGAVSGHVFRRSDVLECGLCIPVSHSPIAAIVIFTFENIYIEAPIIVRADPSVTNYDLSIQDL